MVTRIQALRIEQLLLEASMSFTWYRVTTSGVYANYSLEGAGWVADEGLYQQCRGGLDKEDYIMVEYTDGYDAYKLLIYVPNRDLRVQIATAITKDVNNAP